MEIRIEKYKIKYLNEETLGFMIGPKEVSKASNVAIFTHGFTSHKGSILNWAIRLAEEGMACFLFDLPGHYLGNFSEVDSFEDFKVEVPKLFFKSYELVCDHYQLDDGHKLIFGGHSLGALM
ncbi:alpha/beta fold hydrolase, partial [Bacteriovoracaceae bacterium]|nr:alpha/beta fold hydrolase [Bacteriovoracaceae bacterium]